MLRLTYWRNLLELFHILTQLFAEEVPRKQNCLVSAFSLTYSFPVQITGSYQFQPTNLECMEKKRR